MIDLMYSEDDFLMALAKALSAEAISSQFSVSFDFLELEIVPTAVKHEHRRVRVV